MYTGSKEIDIVQVFLTCFLSGGIMMSYSEVLRAWKEGGRKDAGKTFFNIYTHWGNNKMNVFKAYLLNQQ